MQGQYLRVKVSSKAGQAMAVLFLPALMALDREVLGSITATQPVFSRDCHYKTTSGVRGLRKMMVEKQA